jgi:SNF2 family DNA or RNA helicase
MHVLHAHWHVPTTAQEEGRVLFWAEDSDLPAPRKLRGQLGKRAKSHPFCSEPQTTNDLLTRVCSNVTQHQPGRITLLLPTTKHGPAPSPYLVHDWDLDGSGESILFPWILSGVWASPWQAFALLTGLPRSENLPPHLVLGVDVGYWQTVTNLVLEVLAQQKLLPVLAQPDQHSPVYHARWLPILDGPLDGPRMDSLQQAMPPLCRAECESPERAPSPRTVLETYVNAVADAVARHWGQSAQPTLTPPTQDVARNWLKALFADNPQVSGAAAQLKHLDRSHKLWLRNLHLTGDKAFRVGFRLEAPIQAPDTSEEGSPWQLHYLLQARDDPSLLVPAGQVWKTKGNVLTALGHRFVQPQERLLAGLGYAARLFPPLHQGLKTTRPVSLSLSAEEAFNFMRESAPLLEASGFGVLVPPWWNKPGTRLGVRLKINPAQVVGADIISKGHVTFQNLIGYEWQLSVGDITLTREEFDAMVALKSPLVQIRGQWVQLDPEQIEAAIRFWKKQATESDMDMQAALQIGLGGITDIDGLPVEEVQFDGWLDQWMAQFTGNEQMVELSPPRSLQATLRPYQRYGYSWLDFLRRWGMGACLADDMGLGKTIQTISMLLREKEEQGSLPGPVLLICPTSVVANWEREVHNFAPTLTTVQHQGSDRLRENAFINQVHTVDMVLTSYAIARRDADMLEQVDWFGIVLDEAQNIKNPNTKLSRSIRQIPAQFRIALTGTPVENRLSELWSIMQFLNPGYLGSRSHFRQQFSLPIERYGDQEAAQRLRKMVSPFIMRRVKTDPTVIQDLPDKQEMKVYCTLSTEQSTLYEAVVQEALRSLEEAEGMQRKGLVLSMLMQLKQICNHPAQFLHQISENQTYQVAKETERSGKLARLVEMLEEIIAVDDRALIFSQFAEMGQMLTAYLRQRLDVSTQFLHGGTPVHKRQQMVERFQENPHGPPIFILSIKAGGTGLNLTRANHVFHFDRWWNPAVEDQATDRAFRIGQTRNVMVHKFVCTGTLEEMIDDIIEDKKALAENIVGSGENWLTELSTRDLRDLVSLRREALQ